MAKADNPTIWEKIQKNVQEAERLMGLKKYNLCMIKARQTLEYMVKLQCDKAGIVEGSTETMIRELYNGGWISKSTAEHYLQILSIGNKAAKEGDNSAFNANEAYHVLTQEIYAFSNADKAARPRRSSGQKSQSKSRKRSSKSGINSTDLIKLLIPVVLIIVLIFIIRILTPKKDATDETSTSAQTEAITTEAPSTEAPTEAPSTAAVSYKTTTTLNVRKEPSTDADRIGKLDPDAPVEFVGDYDDFWAIIQYNGQEAYVAKQYLTPAE